MKGMKLSSFSLLRALAGSFARKSQGWLPVSFELPAAALEVALHGTTNDTLGWYTKGGGWRGVITAGLGKV